MIELLNRRFVSFYFNTGGPGLGKDPAAAAFVRGKTKNPVAYYAAFDAAGEPLGVTDLYANKDHTFDFLVALLRENPEFDRYTKEEEAILATAAGPANAGARLAAGKLLEELGRYKEAAPYYRAVLAGPDTPATAGAYRGLLRMARYARDWEAVRRLCDAITALGADRVRELGLAPDVAAETGYRLLAAKKYAEARDLLDAAVKAHPGSTRRSEFHFSAGVACFFLKDQDRAAYHWCWVAENLPGDRLARRCYLAAAHEGMPYENPELGGYRAKQPGGSIQVIRAAYERARARYERVKDREGRPDP